MARLQAPVVASHAVSMVTVSTILEAAAIVAVLLRFLARRRARNLGIDDWLALLALVFATGLYITGILICTIGFAGFHATLLTIDQLERFLLLTYIDNIFYALTLPTTKLSILFMYYRMFPIKKFGYIAAGVGAIVVGWMISIILVQIFTCSPVEGAWIPTKADHCIDQLKFYYGNAISNLLTDVIILCLPMPMIWRLQMTWQKKVGVTGILLMGGFVCISSIVRLSELSAINMNDITYTLVAVGNWTSVETPLGIVCACLPTLPVLFRAKNRFTSKYSAGSNHHSGGSSGHRPLRSLDRESGTEEYTALASKGPASDVPLESMDEDRIRVSHKITVQSGDQTGTGNYSGADV